MPDELCLDCQTNPRVIKTWKDRLRVHVCKRCSSCQKQFLANVSKRFHLRRFYGISQDEYNDMLERQNGQCAICGNVPIEGRVLSVDHNHQTKQIRGLLCQVCNAFLGRICDNPTLATKAVDYLHNR